jgi:hypothetical protein
MLVRIGNRRNIVRGLQPSGRRAGLRDRPQRIAVEKHQQTQELHAKALQVASCPRLRHGILPFESTEISFYYAQ